MRKPNSEGRALSIKGNKVLVLEACDFLGGSIYFLWPCIIYWMYLVVVKSSLLDSCSGIVKSTL